ncbi:gephyrin-like molybdotransferase receptor GlpR [Corynebacterium alimapuense]|uniref:DUF3329 domain-containing protein n=1 Tax=Corynebacterium alimapuense TaxID=1576874 RepID=A0A3M8K5Z2_9CORY|nr:gephyrin-like molybdotransferase receptor GlpR [Corynebacterium alimapuense]RNE48596.1 hypothetical protein C5L39_08905 [Corynebacterium alimapuense]
MSGSLIIVLIIVVWLFVLAPLLLRGQKPISKAGEAFDDTRVLYEGGSGELPVRRRPRLSSSDVHRSTDERSDDYEVVDAEDDVLIEDSQPSSGFAAANAIKGVFSRKSEEPAEEIIDGGIVHELNASHTHDTDSELEDEQSAELEILDDEDFDRESTYDYDDSYTSPADLMYPASDADQPEPSASDSEASRSEDDQEALDDLSEDELAFAQHRSSRGGWDPVSDAEHSTSRYQRRQRTLIGLVVATVVTVALGFILGGWAWSLPVLALAATVMYLVALRNQVRAEEALRLRRVRQLRRARLGVRNSADEELAIPRNLRRPGAVVLELDDESPDFEYLPVTDAHFETEQEPPRVDRRFDIRSRRFGDSRRAS